MSVKQFCKEQGLTEYSFYAWRKRLQKKAPVSFALVDRRALVQRFPKRCGTRGERDFSFHAASTAAQIPDIVFGLPASFPLLN